MPRNIIAHPLHPFYTVPPILLPRLRPQRLIRTLILQLNRTIRSISSLTQRRGPIPSLLPLRIRTPDFKRRIHSRRLIRHISHPRVPISVMIFWGCTILVQFEWNRIRGELCILPIVL